jgi:hypothetical protein
MVSTYFFAQQNGDAQGGISSFSVTCRTEDTGNLDAQYSSMSAKAQSIAETSAVSTAGAPVLVGYAGIPDIIIVLRAGEVFAAYYRNSTVCPCMIVHDLDMVDMDEQPSAIEKLQVNVANRGYQRCVALEADPEG